MRNNGRNVMALLLVACGAASEPTLEQQSVAIGQAAVGTERARFAVEWMQLMVARALADQLSVPEAARIYAYAGVTLHEITRYSAPEPLPSLATQLNGLTELPTPRADITYDWNVALASAMSELMELFFYSQESIRAAADLHASQLSHRRQDGVSAMCADASILFGTKVARAVAAWAASDGFKEAHGQTWVSPAVEGQWEPTGAETDPVEPFFGTVRPFALATADDCRAAKPTKFSTHVNSAFYQEASLVMQAERDASDDERASIARWAHEGSDWLTIVGDRLLAEDSRLSRAGKVYALIGLALADGYITAWQDKYRHNLLRPETYIQRYIDDDWQPVIEPLPYPEYVSSQALVSGAAAEILTVLYGEGPVQFAAHDYPSYWDAALEAGNAGLIAGVQFPMSVDAGTGAGYCVAHGVLDRVHL